MSDTVSVGSELTNPTGAIDDPMQAPFGSLFGPAMTIARMADGAYTYGGSAEPLQTFSMHPGTHVFHYASACFEGLKAHRQVDGSLAIFRLDDHVARFRQSIGRLCLPIPDADLVRQMIVDAVEANASIAPAAPGSLYIRPTLVGTLPNIGAAAVPTSTAMLYVICSPVGDYFAGGVRPLTLFVETETPRTTPQFGMVKSGANYVMALGPTLAAKAEHGSDQVLFATGDDITETGAANFFWVRDRTVVTRRLDESFLHGVTRGSVLSIARDLGYEVLETDLRVHELEEAAAESEMFLSGTAAVIAPVGTLVTPSGRQTIGDGQPGDITMALRSALTDVLSGAADDPHGWRTPVEG